MRSIPLAAVLLLLATGLATPALAYDQNPAPNVCNGRAPAGVTTWSCTITCSRGDHLLVGVSIPELYNVRGTVTCGGASATCTDVVGCSAESATTALGAATGTCTFEVLDPPGPHQLYGYCDARDKSSVSAPTGPYAVGLDEQDVTTPSLGFTCIPDEDVGLLCVGPVQGQYVTTTPGVDPLPLTPPGRVRIDWDVDPRIGPTVEYGQVGPIPILGPPVPVVLCHNPCNVPTGADGPVSVTLTVQSGSDTYTWTLP